MSEQHTYHINLDVKYNHLELIDVPSVVRDCTEKWFNQTLTQINDSVVRLGIVQGEFHWHKRSAGKIQTPNRVPSQRTESKVFRSSSKDFIERKPHET
jgi:hypothetical protein